MDALLDKLLEEAGELKAARSDERIEEMADVQEVVNALMLVLGLDRDEVCETMDRKRTERGAFEERFWLS